MSVDVKSERIRRLVDENVEVEQLGTGFAFTEGPIWNQDGQFLLFSDMPGDTRRRWDESSGVQVVASPSNKGNGMTLDADGRLIVCEHSTSSLVRIDPDGTGTKWIFEHRHDILQDTFTAPQGSPDKFAARCDLRRGSIASQAQLKAAIANLPATHDRPFASVAYYVYPRESAHGITVETTERSEVRYIPDSSPCQPGASCVYFPEPVSLRATTLQLSYVIASPAKLQAF